MKEPTPLSILAPPACMCDRDRDCICLPTEKALRKVMNSAGVCLTTTQREWCLAEIGMVEGYDRADYESEPDSQVARGVLSAWTDYCRDKGLL